MTHTTYIRTVDVSLCIYPLGKAISHDNWFPGQQIRISLNDKGEVQNNGIYYTFKDTPEQLKRRIEQHLAGRMDPDGNHECSVINLFDRDGFEQCTPRILVFKAERSMKNAGKPCSTIEKAMFTKTANHASTKPVPVVSQQNQSTAASDHLEPQATRPLNNQSYVSLRAQGSQVLNRLFDKQSYAPLRAELLLLLKEIGPTKPFQAEAFVAAIPATQLRLVSLLLADIAFQNNPQSVVPVLPVHEQFVSSLKQLSCLIMSLKSLWLVPHQTAPHEAPEAPQPPPAA